MTHADALLLERAGILVGDGPDRWRIATAAVPLFHTQPLPAPPPSIDEIIRRAPRAG